MKSLSNDKNPGKENLAQEEASQTLKSITRIIPCQFMKQDTIQKSVTRMSQKHCETKYILSDNAEAVSLLNVSLIIFNHSTKSKRYVEFNTNTDLNPCGLNYREELTNLSLKNQHLVNWYHYLPPSSVYKECLNTPNFQVGFSTFSLPC